MKTYKTIFYQLWIEIIRAQTANSNEEICNVLKALDDKARKLEDQVSDDKD